jgi:hypothetical protein
MKKMKGHEMRCTEEQREWGRFKVPEKAENKYAAKQKSIVWDVDEIMMFENGNELQDKNTNSRSPHHHDYRKH